MGIDIYIIILEKLPLRDTRKILAHRDANLCRTQTPAALSKMAWVGLEPTRDLTPSGF